MGRNLVVLFILVFISLNAWAQSPYGWFSYHYNRQGVDLTHIKNVYRDKKGYIWLCSSEGVVRWDANSFEIFNESIIDSTSLNDKNTTCLIQDNFNGSFWIGTDVGGVSNFNLEKNSYTNYPWEESFRCNLGQISITSIQQLNKEEFLIGTKEHGLFLFKPYGRVSYVRFNSPDILSKHKQINKIIKGEHFYWIATKSGIIQASLTGKYIAKYCFTNNKYTKHKGNWYWGIDDVKEESENCIVFSSGSFLFRYKILTDELSSLANLPNRIRINQFVIDHNQNIWLSGSKQGLWFYDREKKKVKKTKFRFQEIQDMIFLEEQKILLIGSKGSFTSYIYNYSPFINYYVGDITNRKTNSAFKIHKDSKGGLWANSNKGFHYKKRDKYYGKWVSFSYYNEVFDILEDSLAIWFLSQKGLYKYDLEKELDKKSVSFIQLGEESLKKVEPKLMCGVNDKTHLWIAGLEKIYHYNKKTGALKEYAYPIDLEDESKEEVNQILIAKDTVNILLFLRTGKIISLNTITKEFNKVDLVDLKTNLDNKPIVVLDAAQDTLGNIWLATYGSGLLIYNPLNNSLSNRMAKGFLGNNIYAIVEDDNGKLWSSTNFGIAEIDPYSYSFNTYNLRKGVACVEFNERCVSKLNNGNILFGGIDWIVEIDPDNLVLNTYEAPAYIKSWTVREKSVEGSDSYSEIMNYLNSDTIIISNQRSQIKFNASVLNFLRPSYNQIKWKLEGYDDIWQKDYSNTSIVYPILPKGEYTLKLKSINSDGYESDVVQNVIILVKPKYYETLVFRVGIGLIILIIIVLVFRLRIMYYKKRDTNLTKIVNEKTRELIRAKEELERSYEELEWTNEEISTQKTELEIHRNHLEEMVRARTKDLEEAKNSAERSDKLKSSFLANLSHEIRTPMNAILGFSCVLKTYEEEDSQKATLIDSIHRSSNTLLELINDMVDISKIETGNLNVTKEKVNLLDLCSEVTEELSFQHKSNGVELIKKIEFNSSGDSIITDHLRLKQILTNLLSNAFKFTEHGFVELKVKIIPYVDILDYGFDLEKEAEGQMAAIFSVKDTGIGIAKKDQEFVFQPFMKVDQGDKLYDGLGVGLSIVKKLINLLGGEIKVESEVNKGSEFSFFVVSD